MFVEKDFRKRRNTSNKKLKKHGKILINGGWVWGGGGGLKQI